LRKFLGLCFFVLAIFNIFAGATESEFDEKIIHGQLENGLTYYIRKTNYPEEKASLRLVVKVGSIHENDEEQGWAHFIEHLMFRGTTHFDEKELNHTLESIGARTGTHSNAVTGFDSTIYKLDLPSQAFDRGLSILSDFASEAFFPEEAIEKERSVVLNELQLYASSSERQASRKMISEFLKGSLYSKRFPIGLKETILQSDREGLIAFYKHWYRPDRMAIVAVGDFDSKAVRSKIEKLFSQKISPQEIPQDVQAQLVSSLSPAEVVFLDPAFTSPNISLLFPYDDNYDLTFTEQAKNSLMRSIISILIEHRLQALVNKPLSSLLNSSIEHIDLVPTIPCFKISATLSESDWIKGVESLFILIKELKISGFNENELAIVKNQGKLVYGFDLANIDKIDHSTFINVFYNHFLLNRPMLSRAWLIQEKLDNIDGISLKELNEHLTTHLFGQPPLIFMATPFELVQEEIQSSPLLQTFSEARPTTGLETNFSIPVFDAKFPKGAIVSKNHDPELDIHSWRLSNGVQVMLKKSDIDKGYVYIHAKARGGFSYLSEDDLPSAHLMIPCLTNSGIGHATEGDVANYLRAHNIHYNIHVDANNRSFSLNSYSSSLKNCFQLIHAFFIEPQFDLLKWPNILNRKNEVIRQRLLSPTWQFDDFVWRVNTNDHFLYRPLDLEKCEEAKSKELFHQFFGFPRDFVFLVVGDFDIDEIGLFFENYVASLPDTGLGPITTFRGGIGFPKGVVQEAFKSGHQSHIHTLITIPYEPEVHFSISDRVSSFAAKILLNERLTSLLRHANGGTYNVQVLSIPSPSKSCQYIQISFASYVDDYQKLIDLTLNEVKNIQVASPSVEEVVAIQELIRNSEKKNSLSNQFWIDTLWLAHRENIPPKETFLSEESISSITPETVQKAAEKLLSSPHYTILSHFPDDSSPG
jgi:zinc protease